MLDPSPDLAPPKADPFAQLDIVLAAQAGPVRKHGLRRLLIGGAGFAVVLAIAMWVLPVLHVQLHPEGLALAAGLGGVAFVGLLDSAPAFPTGIGLVAGILSRAGREACWELRSSPWLRY